MATKKDTIPSKKKDKYRIRNWHEYNRSLVNRGSITFWFDEAPQLQDGILLSAWINQADRRPTQMTRFDVGC